MELNAAKNLINKFPHPDEKPSRRIFINQRSYLSFIYDRIKVLLSGLLSAECDPIKPRDLNPRTIAITNGRGKSRKATGYLRILTRFHQLRYDHLRSLLTPDRPPSFFTRYSLHVDRRGRQEGTRHSRKAIAPANVKARKLRVLPHPSRPLPPSHSPFDAFQPRFTGRVFARFRRARESAQRV